MANTPIVSTLFRFVTTRNPQLLTEEEKERGFIYYPEAKKAESVFLNDLSEDRDQKRTELETRAASYANLKTKDTVRAVKPDLYDFSMWLMRNRKTLTNEEVILKSQDVPKLTGNQRRKLWDNLLYQVISKTSDAVREAIIQMIVADNFLDKNDFNSDRGDKFINTIEDARRLANAYVVISGNVSNIYTIGNTAQRLPKKSESDVMISKLDGFEAKLKKEAYITAKEVVVKVLTEKKIQDQEAYDQAKVTYDADVKAAYENATKVVDPDTKDVTYENLVLPDFTYQRSSILKADYLNDKVNASTKALVDSLVIANEDEILPSFDKKISALERTFVEKATVTKREVIYNGVLISEENTIPQYTYALGSHSLPEDSSKGIGYLSINPGYKNTNLMSASFTMTFDDNSEIPSPKGDYELMEDGTIIISNYDNAFDIPNGVTSFKIKGDIVFDNGDIVEIDSKNTIINGKRSVRQGVVQIDSGGVRVAVPPSKINHYGIKKVGVADFRRVEQEVCCYVPGEVSHIENILAKEYKERSTRNLLSTETTTETSTETEIENLTDTTTAERNELSSEVSSVLTEDESQNYGASASVSGGFKGLNFGASAFYNGASSSSSTNSNSTAQTYAEEVTERALERVVQKVTKKRTSRILREFEENNKHGFDNREGTEHVTGVYRWVDKIYNNRLVNYGKRLMYEFDVAEPSKFFKNAIIEQIAAQDGNPTGPTGLLLPIKPRPLINTGSMSKQLLSATDITRDNYQGLASRYGAEISAPPKESMFIGKAIKLYSDAGRDKKYISATDVIKIPDGYYVDYGVSNAQMMYHLGGYEGARIINTIGNISNTFICNYSNSNESGADISQNSPSAHFLNKRFIEEVPISSMAFDSEPEAFSDFSVQCHLTKEAYDQWQTETFNAIYAAYQERVNEYNDALLATYTPDTSTDASTRALEFNPLLNRTLEKRELKRLAIDMMARPFNIDFSRDDYKRGSNTQMNLTAAFEKHAQVVKFFEQCFDWEIMAYTFYPYFYADERRWKDLFKQSNGTDPIFQAFLQSAMARMVVPVKPGFEDNVTYFLETGDIWTGNQLVVERDDDLHLSIAEETQSTEGTVEREWETRVPTALTIVQANSAPLNETGLPCCDVENDTTRLAYGNSVMVGEGQTPPDNTPA